MIKLAKVKCLIIHHTSREKDFPLFVKFRHKYKRKFEDIGYHYLIGDGRFLTKDGKIYKGRNEKYQGAHAYGKNKESLGICLIGNLDKNNPTKKQILSLIKLLKEKIEQYNIPTKNILGHRELPNVTKTCPGKFVDMNKIRKNI